MSNDPKADWFSIDGHSTVALDYPLTTDSVVYEIGGYIGEWASAIISKYNPYMYVFEPVPQFYRELESRFKGNPKVKVFNYGISCKNCEVIMHIDGDASSVHIGSGNTLVVPLKDICIVLENNNTSKVDLVQINIEGEEYALLEHMIKKSVVGLFNNVQIQFHKNIPNYESRRASIQKSLSLTHSPRYDYPFVFESWSIK
jgi:FkbM family methyltransferase